MTAKEFIEKEALEYKLAEYDEGGFLGIDDRLLEQKLEEYHQAKLKLLGIGDVVGQSEQLKCECDEPADNAYPNGTIFCENCGLNTWAD